MASPPSSAPSTLKFVVVPLVTGLGDAAAATAMVGKRKDGGEFVALQVELANATFWKIDL